MEMNQSNEFAKIFIRSYYPVMLFQPEEVFKFYDDNAIIWRPSFNNTNGLHISQCISEVPLKLNPEDQLVVSTFVVNSIQASYSIAVTGYIRTPTLITAFVHSFFVQYNFNYQKFFVVSDAFHLFEPNKIMKMAECDVAVGPIRQEQPLTAPAEQPAQIQEQQVQEQVPEKAEGQEHQTQERPRQQYHKSGPMPQGAKQPNPSFNPKRKQNYGYNQKNKNYQ